MIALMDNNTRTNKLDLTIRMANSDPFLELWMTESQVVLTGATIDEKATTAQAQRSDGLYS